MSDSEILSLFTARVEAKRVPDAPHPPDRQASPEPEEEEIAPGKSFACVVGQRQALALEFIWADGRYFSVPYTYAPLLWGNGPNTLILEYPGLFSVLLRCKGLAELQRRIRDRRVLWIRECSEEEAQMLPNAVTSIVILRAFPSREAGGEFATG